MLVILIMMGLSFLCEKKILAGSKQKNNNCNNVFCYKNKLFFSIYISDQEFKNSMDLLLIFDQNKSHYVYIKNFDRFIFTKQRIKTKNTSARVVCSILLVSKNVLTRHKALIWNNLIDLKKEQLSYLN